MGILAVIIVSVVIVFVIVLLIQRAGNKEMNKKMETQEAIAMITALHIEGIGLQNKAPCDLYLKENRILVDHFGQKFEIPLSAMRAAVVKTEQEIYEKGKSVVGRALIGTLIVPGLGTIIGGMSGIGSKKTKGIPNTYLIINYVNSNGELSGITFLNNFNLIRINNFCEVTNQRIRVNHVEAITL
ncbi:hypothetical protein [Brevibacillus sp. DP1.3A]|uniref:hypothetical protein n=1 Tax=Brevibacillus sp. DP1.3A TaxID=2738867 RepID=UPI00156BDB6C|nr:hypothetical protein [Brevibacillus sp. DP1.3A]UED78053.1 hypothetical protein HP399_030825 [Brevibacillus sp. DP1.3A]